MDAGSVFTLCACSVNSCAVKQDYRVAAGTLAVQGADLGQELFAAAQREWPAGPWSGQGLLASADRVAFLRTTAANPSGVACEANPNFQVELAMPANAVLPAADALLAGPGFAQVCYCAAVW